MYVGVRDLGGHSCSGKVLRVLVLRTNAFARRAAEALKVVLGGAGHGCWMLSEEDVAVGKKISCFLEAMFCGGVVYAWRMHDRQVLYNGKVDLMVCVVVGNSLCR